MTEQTPELAQLNEDYRELWLRFVKVLNHAEILELELERLRSATFKVTTQATLDHIVERATL